MPTSPDHLSSAPTGRRVGMVSTFPPQLCGLATFSAALGGALTRAGDHVVPVIVDGGDRTAPTRLGARLVDGVILKNGSDDSVRDAARVLSACDVTILQHEYGIYGGTDGDEVLRLMQLTDGPVVVVLHTVPAHPSPNQQTVLEAVCALAWRVVVMTEAAGSRLLDRYAVDEATVVMIPHGASPPTPCSDGSATGEGPQLLTWGLLGPGKGIEHVIRALSLLADIRPRVRYTVAGATHPNVFARRGDVYRQSLIREAWSTGVAASVSFDDSYRDVADLMRLVGSASVVVLPYDSTDQVTSGVLVDAIAAGRPVISTAFPHAVELLSGGAGLIVAQRDPVALAHAIRAVVSDADLREDMARRARELAPSLSWTAVAAQYSALCGELSTVLAVRA